MNGGIGIGTTSIPTGYKLAVNGKIIATEVLVELYSDWPDYVFNRKYNLLPLQELKKYIETNNHLPEVPAANEVKEEGINLGDMDAILLKKIEELTLYVISLKEENNILKKRMEKLENK
jgi:hypothetical protein